jgi:hypothetical protein
MIDSTKTTVQKGFRAERPKSAVPKTPPAWRPRCTPTSTPSALSFIARPMTFCQRGPTPAGAQPMPRLSLFAWLRPSWVSLRTGVFLRAARRQLIHPLPELPGQAGSRKRRRWLADTIEWLLGVLDSMSRDSPTTSCLSTPPRWSAPEAGRLFAVSLLPTLPTMEIAPAIPVTSGVFACTGSSPLMEHPEPFSWPLRNETSGRWVSNSSFAAGAQAGKPFGATRVTPGGSSPEGSRALGASVVRPNRKDEPGQGPHLAPIRQRIESLFWTCKDVLTLEHHGALTLAGIRERILQLFLCPAACVSLNYQLGRRSRALVDYC